MERSSVITTFLVGCLTLGFFCLFSVYLPTQISNAKGNLTVSPLSIPQTQSLSEVVNNLTPQPPKIPEQPAILPPTVKHDREEEDPFLASTKVYREHFKKRHSKKTVHIKPIKHKISQEEATNYPLKMYEPLEDIFKRHYEHGFVVTPAIQPAFDFWRNVYARYALNETILHDNKYLDIVYGVLDFSNLDDNLVLSNEEKRRIRSAVEERKKEDFL